MKVEPKEPVSERVRAFVAKATGEPLSRIQPEIMLLYDLELAGDDAYELLEDFAKEFDIAPESFEGFDWVKQFGTEGVNPLAALLFVPYLLAFLVLCLIPLPGWIILRFWFRRHRQKLHEEGLANSDAVRVKDLIEAAEMRRWVRRHDTFLLPR
jgi:hypothetical protein